MGLHCMLDLETMGTGNDAAITAIGAIKFDPLTDGELQKFYVTVDLQSSVDFGLKMDPGTVIWWLKQSDEARQAMLRETIDLPTALDGFNQWLKEDMPVWGNGSTFDNVVIRSAFKACHMKPVWGFRNDRCFRTMKNLVPVKPPPDVGTAHNAVHDAEHQALWLRSIYHSISNAGLLV